MNMSSGIEVSSSATAQQTTAKDGTFIKTSSLLCTPPTAISHVVTAYVGSNVTLYKSILDNAEEEDIEYGLEVDDQWLERPVSSTMCSGSQNALSNLFVPSLRHCGTFPSNF
jgi:hypothetical protein